MDVAHLSEMEVDRMLSPMGGMQPQAPQNGNHIQQQGNVLSMALQQTAEFFQEFCPPDAGEVPHTGEMPGLVGGSGSEWGHRAMTEAQSAFRTTFPGLGAPGVAQSMPGAAVEWPTLLPSFVAAGEEMPITHIPFQSDRADVEAGAAEFSRLMDDNHPDLSAMFTPAMDAETKLLEQDLDKHIQEFLIALEVPNCGQIMQQASLPDDSISPQMASRVDVNIAKALLALRRHTTEAHARHRSKLLPVADSGMHGMAAKLLRSTLEGVTSQPLYWHPVHFRGRDSHLVLPDN